MLTLIVFGFLIMVIVKLLQHSPSKRELRRRNEQLASANYTTIEYNGKTSDCYCPNCGHDM